MAALATMSYSIIPQPHCGISGIIRQSYNLHIWFYEPAQHPILTSIIPATIQNNSNYLHRLRL